MGMIHTPDQYVQMFATLGYTIERLPVENIILINGEPISDFSEADIIIRMAEAGYSGVKKIRLALETAAGPKDYLKPLAPLPDLSQSEIQTLIQTTIDKCPGLGIWGIYVPDRKLSADENANEQAQRRQELLKTGDRFLTTVAWIDAYLVPQKTINERRGSYNLKHVAENHIDYIENGLFIAAMIHAGYRFKTYDRSPNATFNVTTSSVKYALKHQPKRGDRG